MGPTYLLMRMAGNQFGTLAQRFQQFVQPSAVAEVGVELWGANLERLQSENSNSRLVPIAEVANFKSSQRKDANSSSIRSTERDQKTGTIHNL